MLCIRCNQDKSESNFRYGRKWCIDCRITYNRQWRHNNLNKENIRRKTLKPRLVAEFGGKCNKCGGVFVPAVYDFHHTDPTAKEFSLRHGISKRYSWKRLLIEASKCILLCSNCHRSLHANDHIEL
jgi:hypothetical protein